MIIEKCPFCGGSCAVVTYDGASISYFVRCGSCLAQGPQTLSRVASITLWNRVYASHIDIQKLVAANPNDEDDEARKIAASQVVWDEWEKSEKPS